MDAHCVEKNTSNPKLSRLGELMARAAARQQRIGKLEPSAPVSNKEPEEEPLKAAFLTHANLSIGEVMDLTGQSRTTVHRRLVELVDAGLLERRGEGRASRYHWIPNLKINLS